jgi:hypothetical protein
MRRQLLWAVTACAFYLSTEIQAILNAPGLTLGCTCNYLPVSQGFVPAPVVERLAGCVDASE